MVGSYQMAEGEVEFSRENVFRGDDGHLYLPATQRPDGSWRKPRRVKEGYVPQDEVPVYESKGKKITRELEEASKIPVGLNFVSEQNTDEATSKPMTKSQKKNAKRRQKNKASGEEQNESSSQPVQRDIDHTEQLAKHISDLKLQEDANTQNGNTTNASSIPTDLSHEGLEPPLLDKETLKRVRALRKKLKQIDELQARIESGEIVTPDQDQLSKISKKDEFLAEYISLTGEDTY